MSVFNPAWLPHLRCCYLRSSSLATHCISVFSELINDLILTWSRVNGVTKSLMEEVLKDTNAYLPVTRTYILWFRLQKSWGLKSKEWTFSVLFLISRTHRYITCNFVRSGMLVEKGSIPADLVTLLLCSFCPLRNRTEGSWDRMRQCTKGYFITRHMPTEWNPLSITLHVPVKY